MRETSGQGMFEGYLARLPQSFKGGRNALGLAAACVLASFLLLLAGHRHHNQVTGEIEAKAESYRAALELFQKGQESGKTGKAAEEELMEMEKGLIQAGNPSFGAAILQESFEAYAGKMGISVSSGRAMQPVEKGRYSRIPVEFKFRTDTARLKGLVEEIQGSPLVMGIRSVKVKRDEKGPGLEVLMVVEGAVRKEKP